MQRYPPFPRSGVDSLHCSNLTKFELPYIFSLLSIIHSLQSIFSDPSNIVITLQLQHWN